MPPGTVASIDDQTFTALLQRATPQLQGFVRRLCGAGAHADADDVLQEALARAWRHRASFDPGLDRQLPDSHLVGAWLQRLAFRVFCDFRSRKTRQPCTTDEVHREAAPARPCQTELRDEVRHRLGGLPEIERALLLGFHRDDLSLRELAELHRLPVNTVKSHLHRARRRLHDTQSGANS